MLQSSCKQEEIMPREDVRLFEEERDHEDHKAAIHRADPVRPPPTENHAVNLSTQTRVARRTLP